MSKSPVVKRNASITLGTVRDLLPPAKQVAARPVGKDDGVSLSISLEMNINAVYPSFSHVSSEFPYRIPRSKSILKD
jgi:hypothetical protein